MAFLALASHLISASAMAWLALRMSVPGSTAPALSDALLEAGALAVDIADAQAGQSSEQSLFDEPGEPQDDAWDACRVSALLPPTTDVRKAAQQAWQTAGLSGPAIYETEAVADRDWVRHTQSQFGPLAISPRLWIVPSWEACPVPEAINIVLDPGLAFGTGSHPTTRLCLNWLENKIRGGETVLDYGCGSGILAIAALKLGAGFAWGVDVDPAAIRTAAQNARRNAARAGFYLPEDAPAGAADLLVANILANPLKTLAPLLAGRLRSGGEIALSGILARQGDEITAAYSPWFAAGACQEEDGWICWSGIRK